jgi:hypothetical protein
MSLREAAQQALGTLERCAFRLSDPAFVAKAITDLRAALEQPDITITGTYEEFIDFVYMACLRETIYEDSEGRDILVIRVLDAYGMAHSWALEHTRNNLS